jgi:hypothetical protein
MNTDLKIRRSIKTTNSKISIVIKIIAFVMIFVFLENVTGIALMSLKKDETREINSMMWNDFYAMERNSIDIMFQGSSHARFAYDPRIFDKELNITSYNFSTPLQTPKVSYFALQQALKTQKPKVLVYDIYWNVFGMNDNTMPAFYVYDSLKDNTLKLKLMYSVSKENNFPTFFLQKISNTYRYRDNLSVVFDEARYMTKRALGRTVQKDESSKQADYVYSYRGFFYSDKVVDLKKFNFNHPNDPFKWEEEQFVYFNKTMQLCKENNIKVLLIAAPIPESIVYYLKRYDEFNKRFEKLAKEHNLEYIDLNMINLKEHFMLDEYFMDTGHLNYQGTKKVDEKLIPIIKKYIDETSK